MRFVHELEQLIHDSLQEFPMRFQEPRILADDVHDIRRDNRLVVLATLKFYKSQELLDDSHKETLFLLLICNIWLDTRASHKKTE